MSDVTRPRPSLSFASRLTGLSRFWFRVFFVMTVGCLALHMLYSLPAIPIPYLPRVILGFALLVESWVFLASIGIVPVLILVLLTITLFLLWLVGFFAPRARRWCGEWFESRSGQRKWAFRPWVYALVWCALFFGHLGLDITEDTMQTLLSINAEQWLDEMNSVGEYLEAYGDRLPEGLREEHQRVLEAVKQANQS